MIKADSDSNGGENQTCPRLQNNQQYLFVVSHNDMQPICSHVSFIMVHDRYKLVGCLGCLARDSSHILNRNLDRLKHNGGHLRKGCQAGHLREDLDERRSWGQTRHTFNTQCVNNFTYDINVFMCQLHTIVSSTTVNHDHL